MCESSSSGLAPCAQPSNPPLRIPWSERSSRTHDNACFLIDVDRLDLRVGPPRIQLEASATQAFDVYRPSST